MTESLVKAMIIGKFLEDHLKSGPARRRRWKWDVKGDLVDILGQGAPPGRFEAMRAEGGVLVRIFAKHPQIHAIHAAQGLGQLIFSVDGLRRISIPVLGIDVLDEQGTFVTSLDL